MIRNQDLVSACRQRSREQGCVEVHLAASPAVPCSGSGTAWPSFDDCMAARVRSSVCRLCAPEGWGSALPSRTSTTCRWKASTESCTTCQGRPPQEGTSGFGARFRQPVETMVAKPVVAGDFQRSAQALEPHEGFRERLGLDVAEETAFDTRNGTVFVAQQRGEGIVALDLRVQSLRLAADLPHVAEKEPRDGRTGEGRHPSRPGPPPSAR